MYDIITKYNYKHRTRLSNVEIRAAIDQVIREEEAEANNFMVDMFSRQRNESDNYKYLINEVAKLKKTTSKTIQTKKPRVAYKSNLRANLCKIQYSSSMFKTKLYFKVLPKRVSQLHQNNPWYFLPNDNSFTAYCASKCTSTKFVCVYVRSYECHSPLLYLWTVLIRASALIP